MAAYRIKLVRDRIDEVGPERAMRYRPVASRDEHVELLRQKLGEEVIEYLLKPNVGELADIYQAVEDLADIDLGVGLNEVRARAGEKALERGAFRNGLVMEAV